MGQEHLVWVGAASAISLLVGLITYTMWIRGRGRRQALREVTVWKRAYHLAAELAAGRAVERNTQALDELIDSVSDPVLLASAIAVAIRQQPDLVDPALYSSVNRSALSARLRDRVHCADTNSCIELLEIIEVLRLHAMLADAAVLTRSEDQSVVRAACDAVVQIDPSIGLGILVGLAPAAESWVIDSIGRAADRLSKEGRGPLPLSRGQWRNAPLLAQRAINESATFDQATVADAVSVLVGALDDPSSTKQLAAITALAGTIDNHPAAQLALAGALGSSDRMIRFATAAALSDSVAGQRILRSAAAQGDDSDAARIAVEILWCEAVQPDDLTTIAS